MDDSEVILGSRYRDKISGYSGVAESKTYWLNGCIRVGLAGADKEGQPKSFVFDVQQLELVEERQPIEAGRRGGPREATPREGH